MIDAAVILAGGAGRRLGGRDKPALQVAGSTLLERAMAAVTGAVTVVVVGPPRSLPASVRQVREEPPGAGPAAAVAAGVAALAELPDLATVALLAADLPAVTPGTVDRLCAALGTGTGVVLRDADGRRQYLIGVFRLGPLRSALGRADWTGRRLADLVERLVTAEVPALADEAADIDLPADLNRWSTG